MMLAVWTSGLDHRVTEVLLNPRHVACVEPAEMTIQGQVRRVAYVSLGNGKQFTVFDDQRTLIARLNSSLQGLEFEQESRP